MNLGLLTVTFILAFIIIVNFIDIKNRKDTLRFGPSNPFPKPPDERMRIGLAKKVTNLLDSWNLPESDQLLLLGIPPEKAELLERYRNGEPIDPEMDRLGRVGHLLCIQEDLSILFGKNSVKVNRWAMRPNKHFGYDRPIDRMRKGYEGLLSVRRYLDFESQ